MSVCADQTVIEENSEENISFYTQFVQCFVVRVVVVTVEVLDSEKEKL